MSVSASDIEDTSADEARLPGPDRKRKRSTKISCELCKSRKVKCDRAEPACGWCASHDRVCVYRERRRPGIRAVYELDLEEKVNRMEAVLKVLKTEVEDHIANDHVVKSQNPDGSTSQTSIADRVTPTSTWQTPGSYFPTPSQFQDAQASTQSPTAYSSDARFRSSILPSYFADAYTNNFDADLPPYDVLYELVDLYFKHVATWSPILDRKHTFNVLFGRTLEEPHRILLHAIIAVSLRFSKDTRLTDALRERYHTTSKTKVQLYGLEHPNIEALQALVILAIDILGTTNGAQGWNLLALIARNVVQLGLNVEKSVYLAAAPYPSISCLQALAVTQPTSWTESEARRRLLWMVYVLDRYTTVSTSFNFTLSDNEIDRPLPCSYDLFSQNEPVQTKWFDGPESSHTTINHAENLGSFAYHCEVLRILSRIHKFLNQVLDITSESEVQQWRLSYTQLDTELNIFLSQLPGEYGKISQLCHSDPASKIANWIMLHAAFVLSVVRLHSAAAFPILCSNSFVPSDQAIQRCLTAVDSLREIAQDVVDAGGLDLLGPQFAFCLWVSARVLLVHAATSNSNVDSKINFFISTLHEMGRCWQVAQRYAHILEKLINEGQNYLRQGEYPVGTSIKSFSAMRKTAYELSQLVAQRPTSVLSPTSTRLTSLTELEYLDVFDFFNYPKIFSSPTSADLHTQTVLVPYHIVPFDQLSNLDGQQNTLDWLAFQSNGS